MIHCSFDEPVITSTDAAPPKVPQLPAEPGGRAMGRRTLPTKIEHLAVGQLLDRPGNPRTHSKKQIKQLADCIARFGFTNPILADENDQIVAGHGRLAAAKMLGIPEVPVIRLEGLTHDELRAYVIADNRLAELAGWDNALLSIEFNYLSTLELDFDLAITGFAVPEIQALCEVTADAKYDPKLEATRTPDRSRQAVTQLGDHWVLGRHHLLCADSTQANSYVALLGERRAQMVFTDPPYNVPIDGHVSGKGKQTHSEFVMASGEMSDTEFASFLGKVCTNLADFSANGSIHYICMDWRHIVPLMVAGRASYTEMKNLCVWNKTNAGMGSFYRSKHELVFVFKKGAGRHVNNFQLGQFGRNRTNVWDYAGQNTFAAERTEELSMHPTVKPVALVADAIKDCSKRNGLILDAFAGSGTTIIASEITGRTSYALELDPYYCDVTIERWQKLTGERAFHASTAESYPARTPINRETAK